MKPYYGPHNGITIYHGDCREVMPLVLDGVDLVFADPPYGVNFAEWDSTVPDVAWIDIPRSAGILVMVTTGDRNHYAYPRPDWTAAWARPGSIQRADGGGFSHWEHILIYGK